MSPRDPTQLARIAPECADLVSTMDALYSLLEAVEADEFVEPIPPSIRPAARHARAWWDKLTTRNTYAEHDARHRIRTYQDESGDPADLTVTRGGLRR